MCVAASGVGMICVYILAAVLGLVLGSFANCMAYRLARGESFVTGRSRCPACGHTLAARELIPLVSYVVQRGRCRACGAKISPRYPVTECLLALAFASLPWRFGLTPALIPYGALMVILMAAALVDLDTGELPDGLLLAGAIDFLLYAATQRGGFGVTLLRGLIGAAAVAVPLFFLVLLFDRLFKKETMGGGDLKLIAMLCLWLGWQGSLLLLLISCVLGILFAMIFRRVRVRDAKEAGAFPFGPALCLAAWATFLWGETIVNWYFGLFF